MDREFEQSILASVIAQPRLLRTFRKTLREHHFEYTPLRHVSKLVLAVEGGEPPNLAEIEYLIDVASTIREWGAELTTAIKETARAVYAAKPSQVSSDYVNQFIVKSELRAMSESMATASPLEATKRLQQYKSQLEALTADHASDALTLGRNFFGEGPDGLEHTVEVMGKLYDPAHCFATGWRHFDQIMLGGFRPKEVNVVMGPTNCGKSEFLIALARVFNAIGKRVVWYGVDSTEEEMSERVPVSQTGVEIDHTREIGERKREILRIAKRHDLFIYREWSPNRQRVSDIRHHLQVVADELGPVDEANGRPNPGGVDVILVDSPCLMIPDTKSREAHRFDIKDIYYELVALTKDEELVSIATHQANREAMNSISIGLQHVGEALAAVQPVANVLGLPPRRIAERVAGTRRVQFLKLRKPEGVGKEIRFLVNARKQLLWEDPNQEEPADMWETGDDWDGDGGGRKPRSTRPPTPSGSPPQAPDTVLQDMFQGDDGVEVTAPPQTRPRKIRNVGSSRG